jgi:hypothetical protein
MKLSSCETEPLIVQAIRSGEASPELVAHAQACPVCSEVWSIAGFLREEANLAAHEVNALPDPGLIWRKAQARAREQALAKATMPIRMMRTCAIVLAIFAMPWLVSQWTQVSTWLHQLGLNRFSFANQNWINQNLIGQGWATQTWANRGWANPTWLDQSWLGAFTGATLVAITVTLGCIAVGSWYMLREK